jgi:hypothetical protein
MMPDEIKIGVESWGPIAAQVAEATRAVMGIPKWADFLRIPEPKSSLPPF